MPLAAGAKLGRYEILSPLGAGGMGEVYRARDLRLERSVAVKILPAHFSCDPVRKQRFEREAKAISGLNHPNICTLYDVGSEDGVDFLVMECLEGESLAVRLERSPFTVEQVLRMGAELAAALDLAHQNGIIHRDVKPENIMLTKSGAKLLDFGLARSTADAPALATTITAASPAEPSVTTQGTIVGTLRYMSPEQLEGKPLDGRSDVFSLGAVLYESLTGEKAFPGNTQLSVAAAIVEKEPAPILKSKPMTPPSLERAIRMCLAKDREERWQSVRDLASEFAWIAQADSGPQAPVATRSGLRERLAWGLAVALGLLALLLALGVGRHSARLPQMVRTTLLPPAGRSFLPFNFALSPDGARVAFVAMGEDGKSTLWVRALSSANSQEITATEGATYPFWSPDSQQLGFFAQGGLKAVDLENSSVRNICPATQGFGGTWNREGVIVFAANVSGPMFRVPAAGGTPEPVTRSQEGSAEAHHWPYFLPDGKHFLYFVNWSSPTSPQKNGIYVGSLDGRAPKLIAPNVTGNAQYASGILFYVRDRTVMAQPFDETKLETERAAIPVTQPEVEKFFDFWQSSFSVARDGELLFASAADAPSRLLWYDKTGKASEQFPELGYKGPQFSPDGNFLAAYVDDEHNGKHFIRVYDLQRRLSWRVSDGGDESNPVWSPDSKLLAYREATSQIVVAPVDGSRPAQQIVTGVNVIPCDWSADGNLLYMSLGGGAYPTVEVLSLQEKKVTTLAKLGAEPQFSPDGKWVAYVGIPTRNISVQKYPGPGPHIAVSRIPGSAQPRWSPDGKRIYFLQPDRKLMVVSFDGVTGRVSPPELVVQTRVTTAAFGWFQYGVAVDGRFLVDSLPVSNGAPLTLITNWQPPANR